MSCTELSCPVHGPENRAAAEDDLLHSLYRECQGCGDLLSEEELFDDVCEWCWVAIEDERMKSERDGGPEWAEVRDSRL